jgi:hypothetical protein
MTVSCSVNALSRPAIQLWIAAYWLFALLLVSASLYTLWVSIWWGPFRDMWEALPFIEKAMSGQASWVDYWEQYGFSHRPWVSRWFWVADCRWFACSNQLLIGVSLACQVGIGWAVWRILNMDPYTDRLTRLAVLPGVLLCLFSVTQVFNFLHTFDVQWFLTVLGVTWSVERVLAGRAEQSIWALIIAWLCLFFGSLNNFSALVMWPVQGFFLYRLGYKPWQVAVFAVATLAYLFLYFHGLPTGTDALQQELASQPLIKVLQWAGTVLYVFPVWYLSNPFSFQFAAEGPLQMVWPLTWIAPALATFVMLFVVWRALMALSGRWHPGATGWAGILLGLYGYGVAVVTSLGRGFFWDNVYALRYQNIVLLFWIGIILLLVSACRSRQMGTLTGAALLLLMIGLHQGWSHNHLIKMGNRTRDAHLALAVGLERDLSAMQATVSRSHLYAGSTYTLANEAAFLRHIEAGPYADPAWQVPSYESLAHVDACPVSVSTVDVRGQDAAYARLSLDLSAATWYPLIVWFDTDLRHPGLLIPVVSDRFTARLRESFSGVVQYAGFARTVPVGKAEKLYARESDNWCHLVLP